MPAALVGMTNFSKKRNFNEKLILSSFLSMKSTKRRYFSLSVLNLGAFP